MSNGFSAAPKSARSFGEFAGSTAASSLFDAAFSKPVPKKRFTKFPSVASIGSQPEEPPLLPSVSEARSSPQQVFSPPISLPESVSTDGAADLEAERNLGNSDSDDEEPMDFVHTSKASPPTNSYSPCKAAGSPNGRSMNSKRPLASTFDFEDETDELTPSPGSPAAKKEKKDEEAIISASVAKFIPTHQRRKAPVYRHKWNDEEEEEDFGDNNRRPSPTTIEISSVSTQPTNQRQNVPVYARVNASRVRKVKEAHQCLESGELDDFKQDLEYHLSTLSQGEVSANVKCLSAVTLTRKCVSREFRQFIRSEMGVNQIMKLFTDAHKDQNLSLCVSAFVYLMSRDFVSMSLDPATLRIITQMLRVETMTKNPSTQKYTEQIWRILQDYLDMAAEASGKKCVFEMKQETLTPSSLILDALVFLLGRTQDEGFKTELLNLGALQFIVSKVEKVTLSMLHDKTSDVAQNLLILERCFRILESCTCFHKKNQAFLISHRGSILIQMCGKLLSIIHTSVSTTNDSGLIEKYMGCLGLMARVLMNLSHENELCSSKLGQMTGFLSLCLSTFTFLAPRFSPEEKKFDMYVMALALLVNLVERCNSNRRRVLETTVKLYRENEGETEEKALDALVTLFNHHEMKAKNIDEDLDKELAFEDPGDEPEENSNDSEGPSQDGRLDRGKLEDMSESEMLAVVQNAMCKASDHMEDSVVASYIALLVGCLLQQNEENVSLVKNLLPDGTLKPMVDQLQRFLDFMKIANSKSNGCRSIERIIDLLDRLD